MQKKALLFSLLCLCLLVFSSTALTGCPNTPPPSEEVAQDATSNEPTPEPQPEPTPETTDQPPKGVGLDCLSGPRGNDCDTSESKMLCLPVTATRSICYENCSDSLKCRASDETCLVVNQDGQRACFKRANKGEACGIAIRARCDEDLVTPPVFCVEGKCTERPAGGWDLNQSCTPPRGNEQSDCKDGLICVELASRDYRCLKKCAANSECPQGEVCWDEPLGKAVCLIGSAEGGSCERNKREFCKSDDPVNYPLTCRNAKCESTVSYVDIGEKCQKNIDPTKTQGNCKPGMLCLGVSSFESRCHYACENDRCPVGGEVCVTHPNISGDPLRACVLPIAKDQACNLTERKYCHSGTSQILRCKRDEGKDEGICVEVKVGDGCINNDTCGSMRCIALTATNLYCLVPCDPNRPNCPGNGICQQWGQNGPFACFPVGPQKVDQPCKGLDTSGVNLDTSQLCESPLSCIAFTQNDPRGVCYRTVTGCTADACQDSVPRVCLAVQGGGICARDCSNNQSCETGTVCRQVQQSQICGPDNP